MAFSLSSPLSHFSRFLFLFQVPPKGHLQMPVEFKSRFLRPCSATLVLVGKREGSPCGNTLVFTLDTCITNIVPVVRKTQKITIRITFDVSIAVMSATQVAARMPKFFRISFRYRFT